MWAKKFADFDPNWTFSDCNSSLNSPMDLKLDESTACRYRKSPRSLSGRSLHLTFQGHGQGQIWRSLRPSVHAICLLLILWQSNHLWLSYSKFQIWPWKFIVKVMAKVKSYGHIWGSEFNQCVCFLFRGNRTIFGRDIANSIFDLEKSRSRSRPMSNPMVTFEAQSSIDIFDFCFVAIRPFWAEI